MTSGQTRWWWIRHAPVPDGGKIYGQSDLACDCSETALFTGLAETLPLDAVWVTSNLRRTHETASAIIRAGLSGPQPIPGPDAIELHEAARQPSRLDVVPGLGHALEPPSIAAIRQGVAWALDHHEIRRSA